MQWMPLGQNSQALAIDPYWRAYSTKLHLQFCRSGWVRL